MKNQTFSAWGIIIFLLTFAMLGSVFGYWIAEAKLSDETLEIVDDLRWKHSRLSLTDGDIYYSDIEWNRDFFSMWVEDGIFYVETQDGKWFIEMVRVEE